uniref:Mucin n=1 Tax=Rhipicephalus appendiculatus TaxID=34631 RepID=A0A131YCJ4_RHIAP
MKRPRSPCFAGQRRRRELLRRLHDSEAASAAPLFRRKRSLDCGLDRTPGSPPPVKRPRLNVSHAFLREVQETPKEPTFGKDSKHNKQHKNGGSASGGPAVNAALAQSPPAPSPMDAQAPPMVEPGGGCDKLDLSAVLMSGPPLPADAAMELASPPASDEDDPAFNAFNYWKTPFPDVSVDVIME